MFPLLKTLYFVLPPLNLAVFVTSILLNHAFVHPTAPTSYAIRSHGLWYYTIFTLTLCVVAVVTGLLNVFALYRTPHQSAKAALILRVQFWPYRVSLYAPVAICTALFAGGYLIVAALAFRNVFAARAWNGACTGYKLMAEVEVLQGFGWNGGNSSVLGASSRVKFFEDGVERYGLDLVRDYRTPLGWGQTGVLVLGGNNNSSSSSRGGPVKKVVYDLRELSYDAVFTNTTFTTPNTTLSFQNSTAHNTSALYPVRANGTFTVSPRDLSFPELHLAQGNKDEWRFTEHVCLPPRITLRDDTDDEDNRAGVWGELGRDCRKYRICALKHSDGGQREERWWEWVENVWPIVAGVVAWEVEEYSACCLRNE